MIKKITPARSKPLPEAPYRIIRLKDLAPEAKPREKMINQGITTLNVTELLAVILNVGTKKEDVMSISVRLLKEYGAKGIMHSRDPLQIKRDSNIPLYQACRLAACFELGRRFYQTNQGSRIFIRSPRQAWTVLKNMANLNKEQLRALYLNMHYQLIHDEVIALGSINAVALQARDIFQPALEKSAAAVIVAHNHPSGVLKFSEADQRISKKLKMSGDILGVTFLDHLLIGRQGFCSAADNNDFSFNS